MKRYYGLIFLVNFVPNIHGQMTLEQLKEGIGALYGVANNNVGNNDLATHFLNKITDYDAALKNQFTVHFIDKTVYYLAAQVNQPGYDYFNVFDQNYVNLQMLTLSFCQFLRKKYFYQNNIQDELIPERTRELFDDLLALRLQSAECLQKAGLREKKDLIVDFSPLKVSRWNPFYWGNWYDRLHRKIATLPSLPWNEKEDVDDTNRKLVVDHINTLKLTIGQLDGGNTTGKATLQLYVLIMYELRMLIKQRLTTNGRTILRWLGGSAGIFAGLGLAARYFMGGNKTATNDDNSEEDTEYTDLKNHINNPLSHVKEEDV